MSNRQYVLNQQVLTQPNLSHTVIQPQSSQLAQLIETRLAQENGAPCCAALPGGVDRNLRPKLPPIGQAALILYVYRRAVDSYPLIYTTLALANPN